ncbi:RHS repeat-associated core domain-containing protein [Pseudoalteromonas gelatinilytica]|uniref:GIY-YIG domain-containing protein n=1 Tax=Pseudoalteromonas gelatinilytica TaxID=1703256 RepID=A0ABQ1THH7_9GAMM|nr:hypothetical protein GCM10008027_20800 [Pseudoalteromonas profundi]
MLSRTLPLGQTERFTYDEVSNQLTHTDFNGELTRYEYDTNNRLVKVIYSQGDVETFTYDSNGNRTQASGPQGIWQYEYDTQNRLIKEIKPSSEVLAYSYDNNSNKVHTVITYQDGQTRTESADYDSLNRLISVAVDGVMQASYGYDDNGNRTSQTNANGTSTTYEYDVLNRLTKVQHYNAQGALIEAFTYTLDDTGRRTKLEQSTGRTSDYGYDNRYRLTSESVTDALQGNYLARFTYDDVGNRLTQTINGETTTYVYDDNDRITSESNTTQNTTYSYDDNGNTLAKTINNAQVQYVYDIRNRMISLDATAVGGDKADYQYNIDGIRIAKTLNGQATHYLVDNNRDYAQVIAENNDLGTRLKTYLYGDDLLSQTDNSNTTNTYHYDGLGSTRLLSDDLGTQSDSYTYAAFGELLNQIGTTENNYLFTGEQFDGDLDQYYLRARYYDQSIGRFTQQDEWMGRDGEPVTLNKYLYAHADPMSIVDPSGYMSLSSLSAGQNIQGVLINSAHQHVFRKAFKNFGCELGFALAEESIKYGIYVLYDSVGGRYYVGQTGESVGIDARHKQHLEEAKTRATKAWKANTKVIARFFVDGGTGALDKMEQFIIDILEADDHDLRNQKRVIGSSPNRDKIRKEFKAMKKYLCK